ncbi:NAD-dependent epimerase/dehydratase family protein [uncultured Limimaricola sp.]|uniref:NAD-dependent epimerase/dehydratase family protein n=1 Tax=uncultured Limimaricola sp. TaxID=2211667 RepID=UPI0030FCDB9B
MPPKKAERPIYLVTGAAGFVGGHLVRHLSARGERVRALVRKPEQAAALEKLAEVVIGDVTQPETLGPAFEGVTGVYHVAGLFRQEGVPDQAFWEVNVEGVRHVFEAAIAAGAARIVHCSTNGVHSHIENPPANETAAFKPGDLYQITKLEGEKVAASYFESGRIGGVVIRPTMIYGPGDDRTLKLFRMISRKRFFYVGPGTALTHWVDVRDLAEAFHLAMQRADVNAEAFLIGGARYHCLKDNVREIARQLGVPEPKLHLPVAPVMTMAFLTEKICKPIGVEPPLFRRRVSFFLKNRAYDIGKAQRILGFTPRQDFAGEVAEIIADYRSRNLLSPAGNRQEAG